MATTKAKKRTAAKPKTKPIEEIKIEAPIEEAKPETPVEEVKVEKTFTLAEVEAMIKKAVAEQQQPVMQVVPTETVTLLFAGEMAQGCYLSLGKLGQINTNWGTIDVPKRAFLQDRDYKVDKLLEKRIVLVVNGLTDKELERFHLKYKEGEVLDYDTFAKMLDLPTEQITGIFEKLCEEHKRTVATHFLTAYLNKDNRVTLDKVRKLNKLSKTVKPEGLFTAILSGMSKEITE